MEVIRYKAIEKLQVIALSRYGVIEEREGEGKRATIGVRFFDQPLHLTWLHATEEKHMVVQLRHRSVECLHHIGSSPEERCEGCGGTGYTTISRPYTDREINGHMKRAKEQARRFA